MARSNIRVLALDLDGTLTNDEKIVTPRTRAALDAAAAQGVCDLLIRNGIKAIWNFAPTHLDVPPQILVQNENMATSLAVLSLSLIHI